VSLNTPFHRWPDQIVEQKRAVHEQRKTEHLQPLERLPAKAKGDDPDKEGTAGINSGTGCCGNSPGDAESEEIETTTTVSNLHLECRV
jgi:hypothetical protein